MRKTILAVCLCLLIAATPKTKKGTPSPAAQEAGISVFFSPDGGCLDAIVSVIESAEKTLDVQAYLITTKDLLGPINEAHERGVKVRVIVDSGNVGSKYSGATYLTNAKIPVFVDAEHKEAHNKVMIADGATIVTGSFNFTKSADASNAENLLVITGKPKLAAAYVANFEKHLAHSKPFTP